jgi:hypothetical protein
MRDKLSPPWLRGLVGEKVMYALAVQLDALGDAVAAAVKSRFPNLYSHESLPYVGRDRKISRGRTETDEVYASRLTRWLDDHATRGGPYALLAQVYAHYAPTTFAVDLIYASGRRFQMDADGVVATRDAIVWTPDTDTARWARWWLFYEWPDEILADGLWGDAGTWSDGGVWDSDLTAEDVEDMRLVPREWNAGHALGKVVLLSGDLELWDYPDGTWGDPGLWTETGPAQLSIG